MMLLAVQGTTEARFETTAAVQLSSLAEMILMTSDAAGHYAFLPTEQITSCDPGNTCSSEEMAAWQLGVWRDQLARQLPGGSGLVCRDRSADDGNSDDPSCDGAGGDVIKIFWHPEATHDDPDSPPDRQVLRLP
jgi:Tfp pilus assembly protein PilV